MGGGGEDPFVQGLGFLLGVAAVLALALSYIGQSSIVAFIATGVIVNAIGGQAEASTLGHVSEVGIIVLLFMAGLEVDLGAFMKNWKTAVIVGVGQIVTTTCFFAATSLFILPAIGQTVDMNSATYFGLCLCFSSTILVLGYLKETKSMGTLHGQLCLGTLVLQDAASVLGIAVLGGLPQEGEEGGSVAGPVLILFGKLFAAMAICFLLERLVLNRLFAMFARSLELLYLGALGYATGLAAIGVTAGFSGEITAFLAGVSLSQLPYKMHIETKMEPIKTLGVAIFFISLGLSLELGKPMLDALPIGLFLAIFTVVATMPLFAALGYAAGVKSHTAFMLGMLMNQISEFSLILCTLTVRAGVFDNVVLTTMTVAAVVSIIISSIGMGQIDWFWVKLQRLACLRCLDSHRAKMELKKANKKKKGELVYDGDEDIKQLTKEERSERSEGEVDVEKGKPEACASHTLTPLMKYKPAGTGDDWFQMHLKQRFTAQLEYDLKETAAELEVARHKMAATAWEKLQQRLEPEQDSALKKIGDDLNQSIHRSKSLLMGVDAAPSKKKSKEMQPSNELDVMHGMIEGYVIVDGQLLFCTLRGGRMLFWHDKHDVGHKPPEAVWDVSHMSMYEEGKVLERTVSDASLLSSDTTRTRSNSEDSIIIPWEWTIVLGHIHTETEEMEEDDVKLAIHGLEDHSDHDAQDWRDALAVATGTLNPIALRLAHIRHELTHRQKEAGITQPRPGFESGTSAHSHKNEIVCIGYNEMFPAVLALADAIGKVVVVVEYDPLKLKTVQKLYGQEARQKAWKEKCTTDRKDLKKALASKTASAMETVEEPSATADAAVPVGDVEEGSRVRTTSIPEKAASFFGTAKTASNITDDCDIRGVKTEYADIHDPECWEETGMDEAFLVVCTDQGARDAEKALIRWLAKHASDAIFVSCTQSNADALRMYKAGAHYVVQRDGLAMRAAREILVGTVASVGDCSQLVAAGQSHRRNLAKLRAEDGLKFQYETGY